jgi:hypothetical protein
MNKQKNVIFSDEKLVEVIIEVSRWIRETEYIVDVISIKSYQKDGLWNFEIMFQYK